MWCTTGFSVSSGRAAGKPASRGLFQAALCRDTRRVRGARRPTDPAGHRLIRLFSLPLAAVSTSVFIVAILILLLLLYHRDPMCCQFLCSCRFFQTPSQYVSVLPLLLLPASPGAAPRALVPLRWGLRDCITALPSCSLAGLADGCGTSEQRRALLSPYSHSTQEIQLPNPASLCCWG